MKAARCVRWARLTAGLSQRDLAKKAGVPPSTIGRIEAGLVNPRFGTVSRLLRACGYDLEVEPLLGQGIDHSLIQMFLQMSPSERVERIKEEAHFSQTIEAARESTRRQSV